MVYQFFHFTAEETETQSLNIFSRLILPVKGQCQGLNSGLSGFSQALPFALWGPVHGWRILGF